MGERKADRVVWRTTIYYINVIPASRGRVSEEWKTYREDKAQTKRQRSYKHI